MFSTTFEITDGTDVIGKVTIKNDEISVLRSGQQQRKYSIMDVKAVEAMQSQELHAGHAIGGSILGAVLLGPIGAAAGATLGRLMRETMFLITFTDGSVIACKGFNKLFESFKTYVRVKNISDNESGDQPTT